MLNKGDRIVILRDVFVKAPDAKKFDPKDPESQVKIASEGDIRIVAFAVSSGCVQAYPEGEMNNVEVFLDEDFEAETEEKSVQLD